MKQEHDGAMWARIEICGLIKDLRAVSVEAQPLYFLMKLSHIRLRARQCRLYALVDVAGSLDRQLPRALKRGGADHLAGRYLTLMEDAIDCGEANADVANKLLASLAVQLGT